MHSKGAGAANLELNRPDYTSGTVPGAPPMPADLPPVNTAGWPVDLSVPLATDYRCSRGR